MAIVTAKELNDAGEDAKTVGDMANGAAGAQVKSRLGRTFYTLATYDKKFADSVIKYDQTLTKYDQIFANQVTAYDQTLVKYDKLFADRVVTYDQTLTKKVTEFDTSRNAQVKKYDDTLVLKINEFDTSRNAQVVKYNNALDVKVAEFDKSRNDQVTKYDQVLVTKGNEFDTARNAQVAKYDKTLDAKVVEYNVKINSVDADLRKAIDTVNTANTNAAAANKAAGEAKLSANNATEAVANKQNKLIAGDNITIINNVISSEGSVDASTTQKGIVQLNNTLTSTSTSQALTAAQGKKLNDQDFGIGQYYRDMSSSRALNTTYTNSTSKLMIVIVGGYIDARAGIVGYVDGKETQRYSGYSSGLTAYAVLFVPPGTTYSVSGVKTVWLEFSL